ncbi:MAG TPA: RsmE family RNA methyltransferase [Candidatus Limnocylindria bacterium]|nr:RsmE family RNA methyltransferase [Candidatus Limnocylindria bacterium]
MTHRFVVGRDLALSADQARQIASVLRLAPGDEVVLLSDGEEVDYRLERVSAIAVSGTVVRRRPSDAEPRVRLVLALPLLRGEHSELVLESATQLGVARFVPFTSSRSVARELGAEKRRRWERIVREAVETSRRARVPEIGPVMRWETLFEELEGDTVVAWEEERETRLGDAVPRDPEAVSLVIGPEGGLTSDEIAIALRAGAAIVSLGRRPLRAETAAIAAVAELMAALDR